MAEKRKILEVKNLKKYFPLKKGKYKEGDPCVKAVDDITFDLYEGETLGLVGESGCGKSTLGRTIIRLYEPTSGEVIFEGEDVAKKSSKEMRALREEMQFIFQDPYSSLNPRMTVFNILAEPLIAHGKFKRGPELDAYVKNLMDRCGLPSYYCYRYPHQFSGGQRQRIGIARSLALDPSFIICDEPVSALDVSIQSQIINLMKDMQEEKNISYIFISHDLSVVKHISDRVGVMYLGSMMELADKNEIYSNPQHPYTRALIGAIPLPDPTKRKEMKVIQGEIPSNVNIPKGCKFNPRCPFAKDICREQEPATKEVKPNHFVKCHFGGEF
ncbi:oligopeptide/dipeptide ABC transporter ATP-binding protein [Holdemanella biformis]|uniref:ABC transporter ATP-binding protein n=1 Tax=Holdemanella biformis TaxID=1735 RepID=UPI00242CACDC|nr:oligopeptide/dipeptide ABC transporter ATP-binding protein [Holdemanella biformis]MBS6258186.1 ATP-binding cassette domain-containing protein [Holdemanella biformis]